MLYLTPNQQCQSTECKLPQCIKIRRSHNTLTYSAASYAAAADDEECRDAGKHVGRRSGWVAACCRHQRQRHYRVQRYVGLLHSQPSDKNNAYSLNKNWAENWIWKWVSLQSTCKSCMLQRQSQNFRQYLCLKDEKCRIIKKTRNVGQCPTWWPPCRI